MTRAKALAPRKRAPAAAETPTTPTTPTTLTTLAALADAEHRADAAQASGAPAPASGAPAPAGGAPAQAGGAPAQAGGAPADEPRRGPGRPPARPRGPRPEVFGVQGAPRDPANRFEFTYASPASFKQLFAYLKNVGSRLIYFRCRPGGLAVFARDHSKSARVVAAFDGATVNWHYSEGEFVLMFNRESVDRIFASIDRDVSLVTIVQSHGNLGELAVSFLGDEYDTDTMYAVQLSALEDDPDLYEAEAACGDIALRSFPLAFTMSAARFRKIVTDLAANFEEFYIEKIAAAPMQFAALTARNRVNIVFRRSDLIDLTATTAPHEVFRVTMKISAIKSLAMSMLADSVQIHCRDDTNELVCRSALSAPHNVIVSTIVKC
jgi:hypothetical protein